MSTVWAFFEAAAVMAGWVAIAFILAFIGRFLMELVGERVYGKQRRDR